MVIYLNTELIRKRAAEAEVHLEVDFEDFMKPFQKNIAKESQVLEAAFEI